MTALLQPNNIQIMLKECNIVLYYTAPLYCNGNWYNFTGFINFHDYSQPGNDNSD